tara:strand:+ start:1188 stop:1772 length:585 start_codon:yes stop_codon:yes gene_type:complete
MAYSIKDVFYLSTEATITAATANGGSAQLDLSAYIDPIARGRQKGTGLAVYKVHFSMGQGTQAEPIDDAEVGTCRFGLQAGAGLGDNATGGITQLTAAYSMTNALLVASGDFYGPKSMIANANTPVSMINGTPMTQYVSPSKDVPYVIVRDNVCLTYEVGDNFTSDHVLSVRLECAQVSLDQATLNQLLRTQTV